VVRGCRATKSNCRLSAVLPASCQVSSASKNEDIACLDLVRPFVDLIDKQKDLGSTLHEETDRVKGAERSFASGYQERVSPDIFLTDWH
jgi:hypothetical protein